MSPLTLRRYRAERLLRGQFEGLRARVLANVRGRLRASGVRLDPTDLEACYAQAWQGLYMTLLDGQEIASPAGWLVVVTFRRAIEEHRARERATPTSHADLDRPSGARVSLQMQSAQERDAAAELDDRISLRQLFEGLRGRLSAREREAAVLCYLQGLSRSQAAAQMGVSEARMRKLMEGRGSGRPGVAAKVGALVETIRAGAWCEEQGSLMRGLAYGLLDPQGERYRLALMHRSECPACRAYVASLRGLAAVLPPVLLPASLGATALALAREGARAGLGASSAGGVSAGAASATGAGGSGVGVGLGAGIGTMSASGAAGAGGAGGGWLLAGGSLGAKLAVGCLLALGVGAGCVALESGLLPAHALHRRRDPVSALELRAGAVRPAGGYRPSSGESAGALPAAVERDRNSLPSPPAEQEGGAGREFGLERQLLQGSSRTAQSAAPTAQAATRTAMGSAPTAQLATRTGVSASARASASSAGPSAAEREFAPG